MPKKIIGFLALGFGLERKEGWVRYGLASMVGV